MQFFCHEKLEFDYPKRLHLALGQIRQQASWRTSEKSRGRRIARMAAAMQQQELQQQVRHARNNNALFPMRRIFTAEVDSVCQNSPKRFRPNQIFSFAFSTSMIVAFTPGGSLYPLAVEKQIFPSGI